MPAKGQLWELIHPQDSKGQPIKSESGRYYVKCFIMGDWRRVTVDDRIPVDVFGAPLLVGSMPSQLWPLILSKAVIKLMALCQVKPSVCRLLRSALATREHLQCLALLTCKLMLPTILLGMCLQSLHIFGSYMYAG